MERNIITQQIIPVEVKVESNRAEKMVNEYKQAHEPIPVKVKAESNQEEIAEKIRKANEKGFVYVLTNEFMPGLVKIGFTLSTTVEKRLKELYKSGVPAPFECYYCKKLPANKCELIEKALHAAFAPNRVGSHEFFKLEPEQVKSILEVM